MMGIRRQWTYGSSCGGGVKIFGRGFLPPVVIRALPRIRSDMIYSYNGIDDMTKQRVTNKKG